MVSAFQCDPALTFLASRDVGPARGHFCAVTFTVANRTTTKQELTDHQIYGYLAKEFSPSRPWRPGLLPESFGSHPGLVPAIV